MIVIKKRGFKEDIDTSASQTAISTFISLFKPKFF